MNPNRLVLILTLTALVYSTPTMAQNKCAEVFEYQANPMEIMQVEQVLMELQGTQKAIRQETTLDKVNDHIYNLVIQSNRIFDQAVELVMQVNFGKLPLDVQAQRSQMAASMIETLQRTFEIGDNAMKSALTSRVEMEVSRQKEMNEAANIKRAIGFGRDQSSKEFHAEVANGPSHAPGFIAPKVTGPEAPSQKQPIGFIQPKPLQESIDAIVESLAIPTAVKQAIQETKALETLKSENQETSPIGFVAPKPASQKITEAALHKMWFDIELGEFAFQKGQH